MEGQEIKMEIDIKNLHPLEIKVLLNYKGDEITAEQIGSQLGFESQSNQIFSWLSGKELIKEKSRTLRTIYELTELGAEYKAKGTPAERILALVKEKGAMSLPEIAQALGLENKDVGTAFGQLSKEGILAMDAEKKASVKNGEPSASMKAVRALLEKGNQILDSDLSDDEKKAMATVSKKRGAAAAPFKVIEREDLVYEFTQAGLDAKKMLQDKGVTGDEIGVLTPEMLKKGDWKGKAFRSYNVNTPPARLIIGRHNPYTVFLDSIKDKLVSLGFEECSMQPGISTTYITSRHLQWQKRLSSHTWTEWQRFIRTDGPPEAVAGVMSSTGTSQSALSFGAREQSFLQSSFTRLTFRANTSESHGASATTRLMQLTFPISTRPRELCWARM